MGGVRSKRGIRRHDGAEWGPIQRFFCASLHTWYVDGNLDESPFREC